MPRRNWHWLCFAAVGLCALLASPASAQAPVWSPARDPVLRAVNQAMQNRRYADAEKLLTEAIPPAEKAGPSPQLGFYLGNLSSLREDKGDLSGALTLAQRALENDQNLYGASDVRLALRMTSIGQVLRAQKRYPEAEDFFRRAVGLALQAPNLNDIPAEVRANVLASLALLYGAEGRTADAIQLFEEASRMCGSGSSPMCNPLRSQLAELYRKQGQGANAERLPLNTTIPPELESIERQTQESTRNHLYVQAEINSRQAIAWIEQHPQARLDSHMPQEWEALGGALEAQGRDDSAEEAFKKAMELRETHVNPKAPQSAFGIPGMRLEIFYRRHGRFQEAEAIAQRALDTQEKILGPEHAAVADTLVQLAQLDEAEARKDAASDREASLAKYSAAASLYERILKIQEKNFGPDDRRLTPALAAYAGALLKLGWPAEAAAIQARLDAIRKRQ